jgi:large subunit ribosomal protein L13e
VCTVTSDIVLQARTDARLVGIRAKRLKDAAENPDVVTKPGKEGKKMK